MSYYDHKWRPWRTRGKATTIASKREWRKPNWWNELAALSATPTRRVLLDVDLFAPDAAVLDSERSRVWRAIDGTPALTWLVFTRRPAEAAKQWPISGVEDSGGFTEWGYPIDVPVRWRENVWLGVDVSTQAEADELIPALLRCRELCGRLIVRVTVTEGIDVRQWMHDSNCAHLEGVCTCCEPREWKIDWLILQGDVGRSARPCNVERVRELVRQAREAGVPCWVERLGSRVACDAFDGDQWPTAYLDAMSGRDDDMEDGAWRVLLRDPHGADPAEWPEDLRSAREVPT